MFNMQKEMKDMQTHILHFSFELLQVPAFNKLEVSEWPEKAIAMCRGEIIGNGANLTLDETIVYQISL